MFRRSPMLLALTSLLSLALVASASAAPPKEGRLATHENSKGETSFALSLSPNKALAPIEATDIVILFDTSASQTGLYRNDSFAALKTFLGDLNKGDRVKLVAVDLDATEMHASFASPSSAEIQGALAKLNRRVPLGSTDMAKALKHAVDSFAGDGTRPRNVLYIGDGVSRANWLSNGEFAGVIDQLVSRQTSVSSYAIGPRRDVHLLAAIANHTGGNVYLDNDAPQSGDEAGQKLAASVRHAVIWPTAAKLPGEFTEYYPQRIPPLRGDRDTIVIGQLAKAGAFAIDLQGESAGAAIDLHWDVTSERPSPDLAYLPQLISAVRDDKGLSLPTAGSVALAEAGRTMLEGAYGLSKLSGQILASGNKEGAAALAGAALAADPDNPLAKSIHAVALRDADGSDELVLRSAAADDGPGGAAAGSALSEFEEGAGVFLEAMEATQEVLLGRIRAEVEKGLSDARNQIGTNSEVAVQNLKLLLTQVESSPDLDSDSRAQLREKIESAIQEAERRQVEEDARRTLTRQTQAEAMARQQLVDETARKNETIKQLMARFNALMEEAKYYGGAATTRISTFKQTPEIDIAEQLKELEPDSAVAEAALQWARNRRAINEIMSIRDRRQANFVLAMHEVEQAHIPFPEEPPIVYPDREVWEQITYSRLKYRSMDLSTAGPAEQRILAALEQDTELEFIETPLQDVIDFLKDRHKIEIQLDLRALEGLGLGSDSPVTRNLKGISLRSALRLMLKDMGLSYMIQDEVLMVTTPEEVESNLVTRVYPVGDLVVPIQQTGINPFMMGGLGGGMGGGMMGGMGGGMMGGMGGGMGGMGGFGGGMGGMGGGGGFFDVEDELKLGGNKNEDEQSKPLEQPAATEAPRQVSRIKLEVPEGTSVADAWDQHFAAKREDPAAVRQTARELKAAAERFYVADQRDEAEAKFDELIALINAALRNGQAQPWMYEAIALAMQANGTPQEEVERVLMSAVDFSSNPEEVLLVANYLAHLGMNARALALFRDVSSAMPSRPEPYVQGLKAAKATDNLDGIRWACVGILSQAWSKEHESFFREALGAAEETRLKLAKAGHDEDADKFLAEVSRALVRDFVIQVNWTGDADIDMMVEEPSGTVCSLRNPRTTSGGVILGDAFATADSKSVNGFTETYVCPQGFSGRYRVLLRRVWGEVPGGKVKVTLFTKYVTDKKYAWSKSQHVELGEKDALVVFDLQDGRRTEPLVAAQIATAAESQLTMNRVVLQQILNSYENSEATRDYLRDQKKAADDGRVAGGRGPRGGVGFRPVITTLPEGASFSATAVISADRRYVRVTPTPFFSQIGNVSTFNFNTGMGGMGMGAGGAGAGAGAGAGGVP